MKISRIHISEILGIKELEFAPGDGFTEIAGPNGAGKTSIMEAIKAALNGGHDATLLRKGATKGEIVLVLDDGSEIHRKVTAKGSTTDLVRGGKKQKSPVEAIKALTDMMSVNPIDFLRAPEKDRVRVLLESMPLSADTAKLAEITGIPVNVPPGTHALYVIEALHKQIYDDRTGLNRAVREKDGTINQLTEAMPEVPGGVEGDEDSLQAQLDTARTARDAELARIRTKLDGIRTDHQDKVDKIKGDAQAEIDAIRARMQSEIDAQNSTLLDVEGKAALQRERTIQQFSDVATPMNAAIAAIRANRDAAAKRQQQAKIIEQMTDELDELRGEAEAKTAALQALDQYKADLLASLPIPGLEVVDGEIMRDGVPFDRLNTAQQVDIAVDIAKLRAGELKVVCCDGIELLDRASFESFRGRATEAGLQLFVSRVLQEGEFTIDTEDA